MFEFLLIVVLAFWVSLDTTAVGQVMVSQPLVAGWLAGLIAGDAAAGLGVGILLQWVWAGALPLGGSSFPWAGPGAVAGGWLAATAADSGAVRLGGVAFPGAWPLALALGCALFVGESGRWVIGNLRRRRESLLGTPLSAVRRGDGVALRRWHARQGWFEGALGTVLALGGVGLGAAFLDRAIGVSDTEGTWVALGVLGVGTGSALPALGANRFATTAVLVAAAGVALWRWVG